MIFHSRLSYLYPFRTDKQNNKTEFNKTVFNKTDFVSAEGVLYWNSRNSIFRSTLNSRVSLNSRAVLIS